MANDFDIVGTAGVDVVPVAPDFHERLKAIVLPGADRLGNDLGRAIGRTMTIRIADAFRQGVTDGGRAAQATATRQGDETAGAFSRSLKTRLQAAFRSLPRLQIGADTSEADSDLQALRVRLETLADKRIGIDIGADEAKAELRLLEDELTRLGERHPNVQVRADTATARAALAEVRAEIDAVDAKDHTIKIKANTTEAQGAIVALALNIAALTAIPAIPILGAGVGGLAAAFAAAGAGVGAFGLAAIPAIKGVTAAMQAQTAATNDTKKATSAQANAGVTAAQQALQMASAEQALTQARRSGAQSVANAEAGVTSAERNLADAQKAEKQAQEDLTTARKTAADQLKALDSQLANSALDQRSAQLNVEEAKAALDAAMDPKNKNTSLQQQEAQLAYDEAVQRLKDQTDKTKDLTKAAADQRKAGVEGSQVVKDAEDKLAAAHRNTADQAAALAKAQKAVGDAEVQAADAIASAERGIQSARLSASKVTVQAATKEDAYQNALAKLSPSARALFDALAGPRGLKKAFTDWSRSMQPEILPLFVRGVDGAKRSLPGLTPLVKAASDGIGILFDKASKNLKSPFWKGFKSDIDKSAKPAIVGLGVAFGNVFKGIGGIIDAFLPHMAGIAATMDRITGRFAKWGSGLKGSPAFERFLDYVKTNGPKVADFVGKILSAALQVSKALSPVSIAVMGILGPILDGVGWLATNMPGLVRFFYSAYLFSKLWAGSMKILSIATGLYATVQQLATLETWSWSAALQTTGIPELIIAIVIVVAALTAGIIWAFKNVGWFHAAVMGAWTGIKVATLFLWHDVLKPTFDGLSAAIKWTGNAAVWLWKNAIGPAFRFIWEAGKILATILGVLVFLPIYLGVKILGAVFGWLWTNAVKPAFNGIATAAVWLWNNALKPTFSFIGNAAAWLYRNMIKPNFDLMMTVFHGLGTAASWLWTNAIKPTFGFIGDKASWLWDKALKPQFDLIKTGIDAVKKAFDTAKSGINIAWSALEGIAKKPVKFIVDHVYNEGIRPVWNDVAKITGVDQLDVVHTEKWATGGVLPGYTPGRDPHKFYSPTGGRLELSGGEAVMRPEWTALMGPAYVNAMNAAARSGGLGGVRRAMTGGYAGGGILGGLGDLASSAGSAVKGAANSVVDAGKYLTDPGKVFDDLIKRITSSVSHLGNTDWAKMLEKFPVSIVKSLKTKALDAAKSLVGAGGGGPGKDVGHLDAHGYTGAILQALKLVGQPASYLGITVRRMMQESGGNPSAVNLWDSNAAAGHPSVGLMQIIRGTFREYAGPFLNTGPFAYGVSENPLAQFYASMKYALSRYGSLPAAYNRAGGYDEGGWLPPGDFGGVYNHSGKPEPVFTSGQWATLRANLEQRNAAPNFAPQIAVHVGNERLTEHIDYRIEYYEADTSRGLNTRARI